MGVCKGLLLFCLVVGIVMGTTCADGQTVINVVATKDNSLYQDDGGLLSNGAGQHVFVGKTSGGSIRRALLFFGLAERIPVGAQIVSVKLRLNMSQTSSGDVGIDIHRVTASWGEGTSAGTGNEGSGATSTTNDATWKHRFFDATLWTNPGGDYSSTISASLNVGAVGSYEWGSTPGLVSDVSGWVSSPATNFGWILMSDEGGTKLTKRFDSRENTTEAFRPTLIVTYNPSTAVEDITPAPEQFGLAQNYPNPFNPTTAISYQLSAASKTKIVIYDMLGREVAVLVNDLKNPGSHVVEWDATGVPSGVYLYRMTAGNFVASRKLVLVK